MTWTWEELKAMQGDDRRASAYKMTRAFLDRHTAAADPLRTDQLAELLWPNSGREGSALLRSIVKWFTGNYVAKRGNARMVYGRRVIAWYWFGQAL